MYPPTSTARFAGIRPMVPAGLTGVLTTSAPSLAPWPGRLPTERAPRLWGAIPVQEYEGHDVEPAYDVRPLEGSRRPPIRSERLLGLGLVIPSPQLANFALASSIAKGAEPQAPEPAAEASGFPTSYLVLGVLAAVALGMVLKR